MKKVLILGCCGSGKSTFAQRMHQITRLPLIHLDQEYWLPEWTEPSKEKWKSIVTELVQRESWIMDGNYSGSFPIRIPEADTIIYLDIPTHVCLFRVLKRVYQNHGKVRADMPEGCPERFDLEFMHYVLTFNIRKRKKTLRTLEKVKNEKQVFIFRREKEVEDFLRKVGSDAV